MDSPRIGCANPGNDETKKIVWFLIQGTENSGGDDRVGRGLLVFLVVRKQEAPVFFKFRLMKIKGFILLLP